VTLLFQIAGAWCAASLAVGSIWILLAMARRRPHTTETPGDDVSEMHADRRAARSSTP
jgi:hypothetical protein